MFDFDAAQKREGGVRPFSMSREDGKRKPVPGKSAVQIAMDALLKMHAPAIDKAALAATNDMLLHGEGRVFVAFDPARGQIIHVVRPSRTHPILGDRG